MHTLDIVIAFLIGLLPAIFWVWFWLREDKERPEPFLLIALAFISGMMVVPLALPLQRLAMNMYAGNNLILVWVMIEEILKYAAALLVVLWHKDVDEPIDLIIYMIVIALGFSALENALFVFNPLQTGDFVRTITTENLRFLGATLLHVLASGTVGVFLAFAYYKRTFVKLLFGTIGLCIAIVLHALFNFFIMNSSGGMILSVFLFVWMGVIILLLVFEKVKLFEAQHESPATYNAP